jgi:two-component sensor histidine kinase
MARTPSGAPLLLSPWRHELLTRLIHAFAIIALVALVPGAIAAFQIGKPLILAIDVLAYLMLYPAYRLRERHFSIAAIIVVSSQFIVGGVLMIEVGVEGAALLWLLAPLILANLLLGRKATFAILAVSAGIMAITSVLLHLDRLAWTIPLAIWYSILGSFFTVTAIIILSSRYMINHLVRGLAGEQTLNSELNHRVKNNLQLMGSLIQLHRSQVETGEARETLERLAARVTAMGRTFQLLDRSTGTLRVPVPELLESLIGDAGEAVAATARPASITSRWIDGPPSLGIDEAIPLAMVLAELLAAGATAPEADSRRVDLTVSAPRPDITEFQLTISGDGDATPPPTPLITDPLSADIVAALTEQLSATIRESGTGSQTIAVLAIPIGPLSSPSAAP